MRELGVRLPGPNESEAQLQSFLVDIANSVESSLGLNKRRDFAELYSDWIPERSPFQDGNSAAFYSHIRNEYFPIGNDWDGGCNPNPEEFPVEEPHETFGFYVVVFRYMLKVIWSVAMSGAPHVDVYVHSLNNFLMRAFRINSVSDTRDRDRIGDDSTRVSKTWSEIAYDSSLWLKWNISRLRICACAKCETRYYVSNKKTKYCSSECAIEGDTARRTKLRALHQPLRTFKAEAKLKMALAQNLRWVKYYALKASGKQTPRRLRGTVDRLRRANTALDTSQVE